MNKSDAIWRLCELKIEVNLLPKIKGKASLISSVSKTMADIELFMFTERNIGLMVKERTKEYKSLLDKSNERK